MKKYLNNFALFLFLSSSGLAQSTSSQDWSINVLSTPSSWIRTSSLAAGHVGSVESQIANIGSTNPANIMISKLEGFGLLAGGVSPSDYFSSKIQRSPAFGLRNFGMIKTFGSLKLGFAHTQPYSMEMTLDMHERGILYPDFENLVTFTTKTTLIANSIVLGWSQRIPQWSSGRFDFGMRIGWAQLQYFTGYDDVTLGNIDQNTLSLAYGVKLEASPKFSAGIFIETKIRYNERIHHEIDSILYTDPTIILGPIPEWTTLQAELPTVIQGGMQYRFTSGWQIGGEARYGLWSRLDEDYRDSWDVNLNLAPPKIGPISPRFGINWVPYMYDIDPWTGIDYSTVFEYVAVSWEKSRYSMQLFLADSHLFGGKNWQETAVRLSLNYQFDALN